MITTAAQYRRTEAWAAHFEAEAAASEVSTPAPRTRLAQARIDAARSLAGDLRRELADYRSGPHSAVSDGSDPR